VGSNCLPWNVWVDVRREKYFNIYIHHELAQSVKWLVTGWMAGVRFPVSAGIFPSVTVSRPTRPHPASFPVGTKGLSFGVKWLEHEAGHSSLYTAEVNNGWSCTSTPPIRLHGLSLKHSYMSLVAWGFDIDTLFSNSNLVAVVEWHIFVHIYMYVYVGMANTNFITS
jgi:hypothetical protein